MRADVHRAVLRVTAAWSREPPKRTAAWDVSAVISVVADAAGDELTRRIQ
jgi:hypothetical protein